jgi:hypothetical protein
VDFFKRRSKVVQWPLFFFFEYICNNVNDSSTNNLSNNEPIPRRLI